MNFVNKIIFVSLLFVIINGCKKEIIKKDPIITWQSPADIKSGIALNNLQLNATSDVLGTFVYSPPEGTKLNAGDNQELSVSFSPNDVSHYNKISKTVKINVIAKKSPVISWNDPFNIKVLRKLTTTQLNATADVSGTFTYSPKVGDWFVYVGTKELKVDFSPTDKENYNDATKIVHINVKDSIFFNPRLKYGSVADIDGNIYSTITIGNQTWMAENLRVAHYNNGEEIPFASDNNSWTSQKNGVHCYYQYDVANKELYGAIYNWHAVIDNRKLAPAGWHIPSDEEWIELYNNLGGNMIAGGKMKEIGTARWRNPNTEATNESGFTGLPGGYRIGFSNVIGSKIEFEGINEFCIFWSTSLMGLNVEDSYLSLFYKHGSINLMPEYLGSSVYVRCIKD